MVLLLYPDSYKRYLPFIVASVEGQKKERKKWGRAAAAAAAEAEIASSIEAGEASSPVATPLGDADGRYYCVLPF